MNAWAVSNGGEVAYLIGALILSVAIGVGLLVAIGTAEVRSRRGEAERVAAIRQMLRERQPIRQGDRSRS